MNLSFEHNFTIYPGSGGGFRLCQRDDDKCFTDLDDLVTYLIKEKARFSSERDNTDD